MKALHYFWGLLLCSIVLHSQELDQQQVHSAFGSTDSLEKLSGIRQLEAEVQKLAIKANSQSGASAAARTVIDPFKSDLLKASSDTDSGVRARALRLVSLSDPTQEVKARLIAAVSDPVNDVRYAALGGIVATKTDTPELRQIIVGVLGEKGNSSLFRDAAKVASVLRMPESILPLKEALRSDNEYFRWYSATALADLGAKETLPEMKRSASGTTAKSLRDEIEKAIGRLEAAPTPTTEQKPGNSGFPKQAEPSKKDQSANVQPETSTSIRPYLGFAILLIIGLGLVLFLRRKR